MATSTTSRATVAPAIHASGLNGCRRALSARAAITAVDRPHHHVRRAPGGLAQRQRPVDERRQRPRRERQDDEPQRPGDPRAGGALGQGEHRQQVHERLHDDERDGHREVHALPAGGVVVLVDQPGDARRPGVVAQRRADHPVGDLGAERVEDGGRHVGDRDEPEALGGRRMEVARAHARAGGEHRRQLPLGGRRRHADHEHERVATDRVEQRADELVAALQGPEPQRLRRHRGRERAVLLCPVGVAGVDEHHVGLGQRLEGAGDDDLDVRADPVRDGGHPRSNNSLPSTVPTPTDAVPSMRATADGPAHQHGAVRVDEVGAAHHARAQPRASQRLAERARPAGHVPPAERTAAGPFTTTIVPRGSRPVRRATTSLAVLPSMMASTGEAWSAPTVAGTLTRAPAPSVAYASTVDGRPLWVRTLAAATAPVRTISSSAGTAPEPRSSSASPGIPISNDLRRPRRWAARSTAPRRRRTTASPRGRRRRRPR